MGIYPEIPEILLNAPSPKVASLWADSGLSPETQLDQLDFDDGFVMPKWMGRADFDIKKLPPTFMAAVEDDQCAASDRVLDLHMKMHSLNVTDAEVHVYATGHHAFALCYRRGPGYMAKHSVCTWTERAKTFLMSYGPNRTLDNLEPLFDTMRRQTWAP